MVRSLKIVGTLLLFLLIFTFSQLVSAQLIAWLYGLGVKSIASESLSFMFSYLVAMSLALTMVHIWGKKQGGVVPKLECSARGLSPTYLLIGILLLIMLSIVLLPLSELLPMDERSFPRGGWTIFAIVLLAPIYEEILFRVKLYNMLLNYVTPFWAVMFSSLCFGIVHLEPIVVIEATLSGVIFSYFYIQRSSILSAITLHMANNAIAYLLLMMKYQERSVTDFVIDSPYFILIYIISAVCIIFAAVKIYRRLRKQKYLLACLSAEKVAATVIPSVSHDDATLS